ncbi:hypothetical protein H8B06_06065 [Sphingobacterium sp. DN00404]|uniref:Uncharacterized protein n=1 Tax=Sphingobacterium micropteri TaxID=2763501 RepID=A0ABR7YM34_9SPHI|nr:hypothetical protein [Sphingobacterium micropteri]MBD1432383.1 hypothetical protein [Sphingobacterium micropteri]
MDVATKLKIKGLIRELIDNGTPLERKKRIIIELRTLNSDFDDAMAKLGIDDLLLDNPDK